MIESTTELATYLDATTRGGPPPGLITLTMRDDTVYRWTTHQSAIVIGGNTWQPHGTGGRPLVSWEPIDTALGLEVANAVIKLDCGGTYADAAIGGVRLPLAATQGAFRRAKLKLETAYFNAAGGALVGVLPEFQGTIQSAPATSTSVTLNAESPAAMLNQELPKRLLATYCINTLYDAACGASRSIAGPCDKTMGPNGCQKFSRLQFFAGEPLLPKES